MNQNSESIQQAVEILKATKDAVHDLLKEVPMLQIRSNSVLQSLIGGLAFTVNAKGADSVSSDKFEAKPLTSLLGRNVTHHKRKRLEKKIDTTRMEDDVNDLRNRARQAHETFLSRDNKELVESLTDMELRAVAKIAGMDVTPSEPEKIDVHYIDKIKAQIAANAEVSAAKQTEAITNPDPEDKPAKANKK